MIDDETRQRAKEYTDSFSEATAEDPKSPAPDLEPMEETRMARPAIKGLDDDTKLFSDAFFSMTDVSEKPGDKMLAADKPESEKLGAPQGAPAAPEAPKNFKAAFAQARKDGLKVFEFNGKKFTTALKSEMKAKPAAAVSADSQMPAPMADKAPAKPAQRPSIYAKNPVRDVINAFKGDGQPRETVDEQVQRQRMSAAETASLNAEREAKQKRLQPGEAKRGDM